MKDVKLSNFEIAVIEAALGDYRVKHTLVDDGTKDRTKRLASAEAVLKKLGGDMFRDAS
jgi:hypothetical protein